MSRTVLLRNSFMALTEKIGCPEFTRVHDLRHLFSTRAQAAGVNPLLVQEMLGHASLSMTKRYTHFAMHTKREALQKLTQAGRGVGNRETGANDEENPPENAEVKKGQAEQEQANAPGVNRAAV